MKYATGVDTSNLAAKKDFIVWKAEVDKLDINKMVNVRTILNDLRTKVDDLDVGELKTAPIHLKEFSDVVKNKVLKNTKLNKLNRKFNKLDKKTHGATTLFHIR